MAFFALTLTNSCGTEDTEDTGTKGDAGTSTDTGTSKGGDTPTGADVKSEYFTLLVPPAANNESRRVIYAIIPDTPLFGFARDKSVSVVSAIDGDGCLKVHKSYLPSLKVTVKPYRGSISAVDNVCGGQDTDIEQKCELGVYRLDSEGVGLKKADPTAADCEELKLDE